MRKLKNKILVVDDDQGVLDSAKMFLKQHFTSVITEKHPQKITHLVTSEKFDAIVLDMNFRKGDNEGTEGLFWLKEILRHSPISSVILITAYGEVDLAVEAMKQGATDFITKPWKNDKLLEILRKALQKKEKNKEAIAVNTEHQENIIIGESNAMKDVFKLIEKVSSTDANILLLGENGTGKGVIAQSIHEKSLRRNRPFITVDLGAISPSLFESELFGHEKGAFTDAKESRIGLFEQANEGTIFLDEIGNIPLNLQTKLLTVLQKRELRKVGGKKSISIDVRIISATNASINTMVAEKAFRQDLLYRINTVSIEIPPLRKRVEDIPLLIQHFLKVYASKYSLTIPALNSSIISQLKKYRWEGNVRELQHAVERALILAEKGKITSSEAFVNTTQTHGKEARSPEGLTLDEMEKFYITQVLEKNKGNVTQTAKDLGLTRTAMYRRLSKHGL